jgi:prevent-host-death family protein
MARNAAKAVSAASSLVGKDVSDRTARELISASPGLKRLIVEARERGAVTGDRIKSAARKDGIKPDRLDELIAVFEDMGVTVRREEDGHGAGGAKDDLGSAHGDGEAIPISDARQNLGELCNRVAYGGERLVIARRGRSRVALVPIEDLKLLEALEDAIDVAAARKALREAEKKGTKPLDEVLRELGIDTEPA